MQPPSDPLGQHAVGLFDALCAGRCYLVNHTMLTPADRFVLCSLIAASFRWARNRVWS